MHVGMAAHQAYRQVQPRVQYPYTATPPLPADPDEQEAWLRQQQEQQRRIEEYNQQAQRAQEAVEEAMDEAVRTDWRPLLSYTTNLRRVGAALLGTPAAWQRLEEVRAEMYRPVEYSPPRARPQGPDMPPPQPGNKGPAPQQKGPAAPRPGRVPRTYRPRPLAQDTQVSIGWSLLILASLSGLSLWILTRRVKTLDRLT
jgi:hypothetical protein